MAMTQSSAATGLSLDFSPFSLPGMYIVRPDGRVVSLSDRCRLPEEVRAAAAYHPCTVCPERDAARICHALKPVLPFLELGEYRSYDPVVAVFRAESGDDDVLHVARTTMQRALQYVSALSLTHYCEVGRKYGAFFTGVIPFMSAEQIAERVYLNIHWALRGDRERIEATVRSMAEELTITSRCQVDRMRLICSQDALVNAFVSTQVSALFLSLGMDAALDRKLRPQD